MDALSAVLSLLRPASYMFRGVDAAAPWSIGYQAGRGIMCFVLTRGQAWLSVEGCESVLLAEGDCVLLPKALAVHIGSAPDVGPVDAWTVFSPVPEGGVACINGGGEVAGIGGFFDFGGRHADVLLDALPAIITIRPAADRADLRASIERIMHELRAPRPGGFLVAQYLSQLMLLQALRTFMQERPGDGIGWIHALGDRQIAAALNAIHHAPAQNWTIQAMAKCAHMSRSTFALRFKTLVGEPPIDYLTRWRMLLAADCLALSRDSVASIAALVGYESDAAFSTAFRRIMGCSPRDYVAG